MSQETTDKSVPSAPPSAPTVAVAPPAAAKTNSRRGKGSREKKNEKFHDKKNSETIGKMRDYFAAKWGDIDEVATAATSSMIMGSPLNQPPREVPISLGIIDGITQESVDYIQNVMQIPLTGEEIDALRRVARLQVRGKLSSARLHSSFGTPAEVGWTGFDRTVKTLDIALYPIGFYISNIGNFEFQHQQFTPQGTVDTEPFVQGDPELIPVNLANQQGERMYVRILPENRAAVDAQLVGWGFPGGPIPADRIGEVMAGGPRVVFIHEQVPFTELVLRYKRVIQRIQRKYRMYTVTIDYKDSGTVTQLVGCRQTRDTLYEVGCMFRIPDEMLAVGGNLRFGEGTQSGFHDLNISHITRSIDIATFWRDMQKSRTYDKPALK